MPRVEEIFYYKDSVVEKGGHLGDASQKKDGGGGDDGEGKGTIEGVIQKLAESYEENEDLAKDVPKVAMVKKKKMEEKKKDRRKEEERKKEEKKRHKRVDDKEDLLITLENLFSVEHTSFSELSNIASRSVNDGKEVL